MSSNTNLADHLYRQALESCELCDVTLTFGDRVMGAHWGVLVQCRYFRAMYNSGMKEKREGILHIKTKQNDNDLAELEECGIQAAIRYIYTGTATLSWAVVAEILRVADYFQIPHLIEMCNRFLYELNWEPQNCIDICYMAKQYHLGLLNDLMDYITEDILNVLEHADNVEYITDEMMLEIANIAKEKDMSQEKQFQFIRQWLSFDVTARRETFVTMFRSLKLEHTTHEFFNSLSCDYVHNFRECRDHYIQTKQHSLRNMLRHSADTVDVLLLVADATVDRRWGEHHNGFLFAYVVEDKRWAKLTSLPEEIVDIDEIIFLAFDKTCNVLYMYCDTHYNYPKDNKMQICINKYEMYNNKWLSRELCMRATDSEPIAIKGMTCVNDELCLIATSVKWDQPIIVTLLVFRWQHCKKIVLFNFKNHVNVDVKMCTFQDRYIVVMCSVVKHFGTEKTVCTAVHDLHTCKTKRCRAVAQSIQNPDDIYEIEEFLIETDDGVVISKINSPYYKLLNLKNGRCSSINELILPRVLITAEDHDDDVDDLNFGIQSGTGLNTVSVYNKDSDRLCLFDVETKTINEAPSLPYPFVSGPILHAKMPSNFLKCFIECTHCLFEMKNEEENHSEDNEGMYGFPVCF